MWLADRRTRLIALRESQGWRQKDVAQRLGITESYYGMIEAGVRTPNLKLGLKLAGLFGVSPDVIFCASEPNSSLGRGEQAAAKSA